MTINPIRFLVRRFALFAVIGALLMPALASAQMLSLEDTAAMEARLNLTPEQRTAIAPILQESMTVRRAAFQKHGVDFETCKRPGAIGLIRLRRDMKRINADTRTRLAEILSPAQLREYDKIVSEQTAIAKKQIMC